MRRLCHVAVGARRTVLLTLCMAVAAGCRSAPPANPSEATGDALARAWLEAQPARPAVDLRTVEEARDARMAFLRQIGKRLGDPVGYKIALTSAAARQQMEADAPVRGILFEKMLLPSDATIEMRSGARLVVEGDLILRVGSGLINNVSSPEEAIHYMDAVYPFLEVADLLYEPGIPLSGVDLQTINAGARFGILGEPIRVSAREDWFRRLASVRVELSKNDGPVRSHGQGSDVLGHPLAAVLWVRDSLRAEGGRLKGGDLVSIGSLTELVPAEAGSTFIARYTGLTDGEPIEIRVHFQ